MPPVIKPKYLCFFSINFAVRKAIGVSSNNNKESKNTETILNKTPYKINRHSPINNNQTDPTNHPAILANNITGDVKFTRLNKNPPNFGSPGSRVTVGDASMTSPVTVSSESCFAIVGLPHFLQNFALFVIIAPHLVQNILTPHYFRYHVSSIKSLRYGH